MYNINEIVEREGRVEQYSSSSVHAVWKTIRACIFLLYNRAIFILPLTLCSFCVKWVVGKDLLELLNNNCSCNFASAIRLHSLYITQLHSASAMLVTHAGYNKLNTQARWKVCKSGEGDENENFGLVVYRVQVTCYNPPYLNTWWGGRGGRGVSGRIWKDITLYNDAKYNRTCMQWERLELTPHRSMQRQTLQVKAFAT